MIDSHTMYSKLPYFLQNYVDRKGWRSFHEIQLKAFDTLNRSKAHLLISAGTSSGKTEAAFIPILTQIFEQCPDRISVLYISPLIALIDDQYERLTEMTYNSEIQVHSWHGDISSSKKRTILDRGSGVLQITPESLDNIVYKGYKKIYNLFHDLKFIVIDEVHSFMNSERGLQLLCQIGVIERLAGCKPRRVGLSATLSNLTIAQDWLSGSSGITVDLIESDSSPQYDLTLRFSHIEPKGSENRLKTLLNHYMKIYYDSQNFNCIVFANGRTAVENTVANLKLISESKEQHKEILAHHSSVGKEFKKYAEEMIKNPQFKCTVVATSTLELGIDVGDLDRIIQINAPNSVSSFVQKMGRSGRRTGKSVMYVHTNNDRGDKLSGIQTDLIKAIAETLLLQEGWVEPIHYSKMPFSLLFQQTVTYIKSRITATKEELISDVLSLYPFKLISENDYSIFIQHLLNCNILVYNSYYATYSLDDLGERLSSHFDFGSNFITIKEMDVYNEEKLIGTIQSAQGINGRIQLSGHAWKIISVDDKSHRYYVIPSEVNTETFWKSGASDIHTRILQTMYHVLQSEEDYDFLDDDASKALISSRKSFRKMNLNDKLVRYEGKLCLFPWLGTIQFDTLYRILNHLGIATAAQPPFSITLNDEYNSLTELDRLIQTYIHNHHPSELVYDEDVLNVSTLGKYNRFVDKDLLKKQFIIDRLDFDLQLLCTNQ